MRWTSDPNQLMTPVWDVPGTRHLTAALSDGAAAPGQSGFRKHMSMTHLPTCSTSTMHVQCKIIKGSGIQ